MSARTRSTSRLDPGALVMVGIEGKVLDAAQAAFLRRNRIRAVVLFRANLGSEAEVRALTAALRKTMGPRALIAHRPGRRRGRPRRRSCRIRRAAMALGAAGTADARRRSRRGGRARR